MEKYIVRKKDLIMTKKKNIIKEIYIVAEIFDNIYYPFKEDKFKKIKIDVKNIMLKTAKPYNIRNDLLNKVFEKMPSYFEVIENDDNFYIEDLEFFKQIIIDLIK